MSIRVMVVDDGERFRSVVRGVLEEEGAFSVVAEAVGALEALALLSDVKPDVIVLDHGLPTMNGIQVAEEILRRRPGQVIVLLAGELGDDRRQAALDAGVQGCLSKFAVRELVPLILHLVGPVPETEA